MKNADMPAMPQSGFSTASDDRYLSEDCGGEGLTKREMFAMHALSSVLDKYNPYESGDFDSGDYEETAKHAVGIADALLKELEK